MKTAGQIALVLALCLGAAVWARQDDFQCPGTGLYPDGKYVNDSNVYKIGQYLWFTNYNGPPPARGIIATSAIGPELTARIKVDFDPGEYVLYCMANAEGKFHLLDGAITSFTVE